MKNNIEIRQATQEDISEITSLFRDTIIHVNAKDYTENQIEIWASGADDIKKWQDRIDKFYFIVATTNNEIVGFAYLKSGNYIDGLFVHKDHQRKGIGSKLLRIMESHAEMHNFNVLKSDVSKTALPFFDNKYFNVIKKLKKNYKGLIFENFLVEKSL